MAGSRARYDVGPQTIQHRRCYGGREGGQWTHGNVRAMASRPTDPPTHTHLILPQYPKWTAHFWLQTAKGFDVIGFILHRPVLCFCFPFILLRRKSLVLFQTEVTYTLTAHCTESDCSFNVHYFMSGAQLPQSLPHVKRVAQIELIALGFIELPHYKFLFVIQWPRSQAEVRGRILGECNLSLSGLSWHIFVQEDEGDGATLKLSRNVTPLVSDRRRRPRQQSGITRHGRRGWSGQEEAEETRHLPQSGHKYNESMALPAPYGKAVYPRSC